MARSEEGRSAVLEDCRVAPGSRWRRYLKGSGSLEQAAGSWRFVTNDTSPDEYSNAQIDDYQGLSRRHFPWQPPLTMRVRARFSHAAEELQGTAGFGFWNDPFLMTGWRLPALPRAIWFFFASQPSNLVLDLGTPGCGWKAMTLDARRWPFIRLGPVMPLAGLLMNNQALRRALWPSLQRTALANEVAMSIDMTTWHDYRIDWLPEYSRLIVDDEAVLEGVPSPGGPLGFVLWLDNQYAIVTPWGRVGHGLLSTSGRQWLETDEVRIETERYP